MSLTVALAQCNVTVGDLRGNQAKILDALKQGEAQNADLVVLSEFCVTGYPPEDLILRRSFQKEAMRVVEILAQETKGSKTALCIGGPWVEEGKLYNAVLLLEDGDITHRQYKYDLPNYGVFDEKRVFAAGPLPVPVEFRGISIGLMICEDMWNEKVAESLKEAELLIAINGSPFEITKHRQRIARANTHNQIAPRPLIYVNQVCGQDDLVFDGDSFVLSKEGELVVRLPRAREAIEITSWQHTEEEWVCTPGNVVTYDSIEQVMYQVMMLGLRDYVEKNGFPGVLLGLSGGIDSALTAAVAVDALGSDRVYAVMMPSKFTSKESLEDAQACAGKLGIGYQEISIEEGAKLFDEMLSGVFVGKERDITEENIQSRLRGLTLMAMSNKLGHMVVATGNKSEMAVGYSTLYGDMCGGYSVIKDVYKTQVYALSQWRNKSTPEEALGPEEGVVIPERIMTKAPTAELRENQTDQDSLPPYETLDAILEMLVEQDASIEEVVKAGYDRALVEQVYRLLYVAEYKRRQSAPGVKISTKPFDRDRRYPITNKFRT